MNPHETLPDLDALEKLRDAHARVREQIHAVVVGQDDVIDELMAGIFAGGHCILEGVPGLAKTLLVQTLAKSLSLEFGRIQFTPDLMPADITGTEVIYDDRQSGHREFRFVHGPIFTNLLLADEINRTPPKTQAALLEAMQERHVSSGTKRYPLPEPFFVLATQNPIEQEGTYPLPEAQLDRFVMKIIVSYPTPEEERRIYRVTTGSDHTEPKRVLDGLEVLELQRLVRRIPISDLLIDYTMALILRHASQQRKANRFRQTLGDVGRRPAGRTVVDSGRQGPGRARRAARSRRPRHSGHGPISAQAPHRPQLFGRSRRTESRHGDPSASGSHPTPRYEHLRQWPVGASS